MAVVVVYRHCSVENVGTGQLCPSLRFQFIPSAASVCDNAVVSSIWCYSSFVDSHGSLLVILFLVTDG